MKNISKSLSILSLVFVTVMLMAFIPSTKKVNNNDDTNCVSPDPGTQSNIWVGWKEVDVYENTSNTYVVKYSDIVTPDPNHTISWGCGYLDIDPNTPGWNCTVNEQYYSASGADGCQYITVHSYGDPSPGEPATHTIRVRVIDDQGEVSNLGGITLNIHYTANPSNGMPSNPCLAY